MKKARDGSEPSRAWERLGNRTNRSVYINRIIQRKIQFALGWNLHTLAANGLNGRSRARACRCADRSSLATSGDGSNDGANHRSATDDFCALTAFGA